LIKDTGSLILAGVVELIDLTGPMFIATPVVCAGSGVSHAPTNSPMGLTGRGPGGRAPDQ
jgi:hypothetical protein